MPRRGHEEELESGSINLLPDEMRSAEYKDRASSRSNEAPYQLRAPKKERKRRRFFTWLPFFGGEHWESPGADVAKGHATSAEAETGRIITTGSRPEEPWKSVPGIGASPIVPISDEKTGPVSPKAGKAFKKGFGFPGLPSWLGGKKKIVIPVPSGAQFGALREHKTEMPSHHYSLLPAEEQKRTEQTPASVPVQSTPTGMPMISTTDTIDTADHQMTAMPARPVGTMSKSIRPHRGFRWPRWLDIFYLIELIATPGTRHAQRVPHASRPKTDKGSGNIGSSRIPMPSIATATPPLFSVREEKQGSELIRPIVSVTAPPQPIVQPPSMPIRPITPVPQQSKMKKEKRKFSFSFLHWLNFFAWFRARPKHQKITMPVPPRPSERPPLVTPAVIPIPSAPLPIQAVVPQIPIPVTPPVVQMDAARPNPAPVSPPIPSSPAAGPIIPITPKPEPLRPGGVQLKHEKPHAGFHLPGKLDLDELAMQFKDVNLIPGEYTLRSWRSIAQSLVIAVVAVGVLAAVSYVLLNMEESRIKNRSAAIDTEIQKFKNDILFYQKQEPVMTSIGTRIDLVKKLLGTHIYWTNFLSMLEKYTLPDVHYDGISATPSGKLSLSAHGSNFETVTKALQLLSSPVASEFVSTVSITGAHQVVSADGVTRADFVIELTLNPDLFYYHDGQKE